MKCKKIPEFEEQYVVSRDGRVFRKLNDGHKEISPAQNDDGYKTVVLYKDGEPHFKYVHALVADAWMDNPDGKEIVNHEDGDKTNPSLDNLSFADASENTQHAYDHKLAKGPRGEANGKAKLTKKQVSSIKNSKKPGIKLASLYKVTPATISLIRNGHRW